MFDKPFDESPCRQFFVPDFDEPSEVWRGLMKGLGGADRGPHIDALEFVSRGETITATVGNELHSSNQKVIAIGRMATSNGFLMILGGRGEWGMPVEDLPLCVVTVGRESTKVRLFEDPVDAS